MMRIRQGPLTAHVRAVYQRPDGGGGEGLNNHHNGNLGSCETVSQMKSWRRWTKRSYNPWAKRNSRSGWVTSTIADENSVGGLVEFGAAPLQDEDQQALPEGEETLSNSRYSSAAWVLPPAGPKKAVSSGAQP